MLIVHFISSHSQNDADPWQANLFLCWNQPGEVQSLSRHHPNLPSSSHSLSTSRKVYQCHGDSRCLHVVHHLLICEYVYVGVDVGVDVDAGVVFHVILPAAHTAGRQVLDVSVLLHLPET